MRILKTALHLNAGLFCFREYQCENYSICNIDFYKQRSICITAPFRFILFCNHSLIFCYPDYSPIKFLATKQVKAIFILLINRKKFAKQLENALSVQVFINTGRLEKAFEDNRTIDGYINMVCMLWKGTYFKEKVVSLNLLTIFALMLYLIWFFSIISPAVDKNFWIFSKTTPIFRLVFNQFFL